MDSRTCEALETALTQGAPSRGRRKENPPVEQRIFTKLDKTPFSLIMADQQGGTPMKRILLAAVLGGIAMFIWSFIAHTVLPLGEAGIKEFPNEQPVLSAMQTGLGQASGLYIFPGMGVSPSASRQERSAAMQQYGQKLAASPSGLLIYHPPGASALTPGQLTTEFLTEFVEALLVAILLSQMGASSFGSRIGLAFVIALVGAITTNIPYWNWYGFPLSYTLPYACTQIVGYLIAGIVAASLLKTQAPQAVAARA